ncbi:MAG: DNA starvation/stationary phase protection protein [Bdellovibrionales bacterium]|nr:DNA starvation/stationary phase protection protein [Bdellovibrionales bacterium]
MRPEIGITDENRENVFRILNRVLADEYVLFTKTYKYHWNVRGRRFHDLHEFFEQQYNSLFKSIDATAERMRFLGKMPGGSLQEFLQNATLKEDVTLELEAQAMIKNLLSDHESIIENLRHDLRRCDQEYNDMGTSDFLTGKMQQHEEMAWMLRSSIDD